MAAVEPGWVRRLIRRRRLARNARTWKSDDAETVRWAVVRLRAA